jgi:hypothetical protein
LSDRGHREGPGALKPHRIAGATIKFEESIAIAAGAIAEVGAFGVRSSSPSEFAACNRSSSSIDVNGASANAVTISGAP